MGSELLVSDDVRDSAAEPARRRPQTSPVCSPVSCALVCRGFSRTGSSLDERPARAAHGRIVLVRMMRGMRSLLPILLVALVGASLVVLPTLCPDDLLVDLGAPDQCGPATPSHDGSPVKSSPSICGCACHMSLDRGSEPPVLPILASAEVEAPAFSSLAEPHYSLITHPPLG